MNLLVANTEGVCQACGLTVCGSDMLVCGICVEECRMLHEVHEDERDPEMHLFVGQKTSWSRLLVRLLEGAPRTPMMLPAGHK